MNDTRDLLRRTSLLFAKYPLLWLPLVLAEVLRTILQWFSQPLTRAALLAVAPRSALGGGIAGPPPPWKINLISGGIGFLSLALGLWLLLYALGIVARALEPGADLRRGKQPELHFEIPAGLGMAWVQITGLAAIFFLFSAEFVSTVVVPWAVRSHMKPGLVQTIILSVVLPVLLLVLYFAVGPLRRFALRVQSQQGMRQGARLPYWFLLVVAALCSNLAGFGIRYLTRRSMPAAATQSLPLLTLQILISVVVAFPYAYAMTGLSLSPKESSTSEAGVLEP